MEFLREFSRRIKHVPLVSGAVCSLIVGIGIPPFADASIWFFGVFAVLATFRSVMKTAYPDD